MATQIFIRIEQGSFESGFPVSLLEIWQDGELIAREYDCFQLPPNQYFPILYDQWRNIHAELGREIRAIKIPEEQITNVSSLNDCYKAAQALESNVNNWFRELPFRAIITEIIRRLREEAPNKSVRVIIDTSNDYLRKISWDSWDLLEEEAFFPQGEFAILSQFNRRKKTWQKPIHILAIFGSDQGRLKLEEDRKLINDLNRHGARITSIPARGNSLTLRELFDAIKLGNWDIIFYAGHSSDKTIEYGSIDQLRGALKKAAPKVKLAIFNSCDGLGIAEYLADFDIPNMIVMQEPVSDLVARHFLQYFLKEFIQGKPLHTSVREARRALQRLEVPDRDGLYYPRASKIPVLIQNPTTPELYWPSRGGIPLIRQIIELLEKGSKILARTFRNRHFRTGLILLFLLTVIVVVGISRLPKPQPTPQPQATPEPIGDKISKGEDILLEVTSEKKEEGVKAVREKNYSFAAKYFQENWNEKRDPETLIYFNNAILEETGVDYYTIAVAVPALQDETGKVINTELAGEILRGVAQAQTEVNLSLSEKFSNLTLPTKGPGKLKESKKLNGKGLKVIIVNDANRKEQAKTVANQIVKRSDILGIVGHWTSDMTMATVDIYNQNQLVMVSPGTSTSQLTEKPRPFFFRTTTTTKKRAEKMVDVFMSNPVNQKRVATFSNPYSPYSGDYKEQFEKKFKEKQGDIIDSRDISQPNFDAKGAIKKIRNSGELAIALIPDGQVSSSVDNTMKIIQENNGQNWIVGNWSVYSPKTLNIAQPQLIEKLIVIVPWHSLSNPDSYFSQTTKKLWRGPVSGRTALSYDAAQVLIKGIEEHGGKPTRPGIQKTLAGENFRVDGVTGEITFQEGKGDRKIQPLELVKVVPCESQVLKFAFIPDKYSKPEDAELECGNSN